MYLVIGQSFEIIDSLRSGFLNVFTIYGFALQFTMEFFSEFVETPVQRFHAIDFSNSI